MLQTLRELCQNRRCEQAVELMEKCASRQSADFQLYFQLGICYSGACWQHPLADADMAIGYLRHGLSLIERAAREPVRASMLDALSNCYLRSRRMPRDARFRAAIESARAAADLYRACGCLDDWAREEYNIANACCELSRWPEAVSHYEQALEVRTPQHAPEHYAATMENLGTAYRQLSEVKKAIDCYRRAARVYTAAGHPKQNASLHNNLGNAYLSLPAADEPARCRNARRALRHLDRTLRVTSRGSVAEYGRTQFNRAQALFLLHRAEVACLCLEQAQRAFLLSGQSEMAELARQQLEKMAALDGRRGGECPTLSRGTCRDSQRASDIQTRCETTVK